jgi:hypothetical protein
VGAGRPRRAQALPKKPAGGRWEAPKPSRANRRATDQAPNKTALLRTGASEGREAAEGGSPPKKSSGREVGSIYAKPRQSPLNRPSARQKRFPRTCASGGGGERPRRAEALRKNPAGGRWEAPKPSRASRRVIPSAMQRKRLQGTPDMEQFSGKLLRGQASCRRCKDSPCIPHREHTA